ncbi:MAG: thioredoxin family protein [Humidesulfovibrio sp.]|nr:thioredoxin family protein [Humidesulfovibrio sp.]
MPRAQVIGLILVVLVLGLVIGLKTGKRAAGPPVPAPAAANPALPRLVDLGSTTCIPCKKMAPILEELKTELAGKIRVEFIDINVNTAAADEFKINVIPTQVFLDRDGKEVFRHEGFFPKADILAQLGKMGVEAR